MRAVILAAGKGVRMKSDLPKVLHRLCGKTLISHVVEHVRQSGVDDITVVVGYCGEAVMSSLGDSVNYVWQKEQLGTGHAVLQAKQHFASYDGNVLIACGDAPLISSSSIRSLFSLLNGNVKGAVLTATLDEPRGYGRIIKKDSYVECIVEEKDASNEQKLVKEVNTGTYVFNSVLLFEALEKIGCNNAQNEYYLPDVVKYINSRGFHVASCTLANSYEGSGVNSPEELDRLEKFLLKIEAKNEK